MNGPVSSCKMKPTESMGSSAGWCKITDSARQREQRIQKDHTYKITGKTSKQLGKGWNAEGHEFSIERQFGENRNGSRTIEKGHN
eukprot:1814179-Rhodomonas_salina.1